MVLEDKINCTLASFVHCIYTVARRKVTTMIILRRKVTVSFRRILIIVILVLGFLVGPVLLAQ